MAPGLSYTGHLRVWRIAWRFGGTMERLLETWFFAGTGLGLALILMPLLMGSSLPYAWARFSLVGFSVVATLLPTVWALETASVLRAFVEAGLENPELGHLKIRYLQEHGRNGRNPVAGRWAFAYIVTYLVWVPVGIFGLPLLGIEDFPPAALLDAVFIFGMILLSVGRIRVYYLNAQAQGYPIASVSADLQGRGLRK